MPKIDDRTDSVCSARSACNFIQDQLSFRGIRGESQPLIGLKLALARTGAVTLDTNTVNVPPCP